MDPTSALLRAADIFDPPSGREDGWSPLPHQIPPSDPTSPNFNPELGVTGWFVWMMMAGRGAGKTDGAAYYVSKYARTHPNIRIAIIAPTLGDARSACVDGPSGLLAHDHSIRVHKTPDYYLKWPNGSRADIFGAHTEDDVERLRAGGNRHLVWAEELAAWRYLEEAWDQMEFGLRLGQHPHVVASTTPKNRRKIRQLVEDPSVIVTRGTTLDNPHLHETARARLLQRYEGTQIGRQELYGELLQDIANALWSRETIDKNRVTPGEFAYLYPDYATHIPTLNSYTSDLSAADPSPATPATKNSPSGASRPSSAGAPGSYEQMFGASPTYLRMDHIVVAVDPAMTSKKTSDDTGLVVVARMAEHQRCPFHDKDDNPKKTSGGCVFILEDATGKYTPDQWGNKAVNLFEKWAADRIIGEVNNGGDLVESNIRAVDRAIPFKQVRASRGKAIRAEPVSALYEQNRVHHVGEFIELEEQLATWEPEADWSPDRLDALVWGVADLGIITSVRNLKAVAPIGVGTGGNWTGAERKQGLSSLYPMRRETF